MGRPSNYSYTAASRICQLIGIGQSLNDIAGRAGFPKKPQTICDWLTKHSEFRELYASARVVQQDWAADEVVRTGKRAIDGEIDPQAARVYTDALKWRAGKLNSKYADRQVIELDASDRLLKTIEAAESRVKLASKVALKQVAASSDTVDI